MLLVGVDHPCHQLTCTVGRQVANVQESNLRVISRAQELGVTFFDTADVYGPFTNEELLGMHLR